MTEREEPLRTLAEVAEELGLSLHRVREAAEALEDRIAPEEAARDGRRVGRGRLYGPEAVALIGRRALKAETRRHQATEEGAAYWQAVAAVRVAATRIFHVVNALDDAYRLLRKTPPSGTRFIHSLPHPALALALPLEIQVAPLRRSSWRASFTEAGLEAKGKGREGAVQALRRDLVNAYFALREHPEQDPEQWAVLEQLIFERRPRKPRRRDASQEGLHEA